MMDMILRPVIIKLGEHNYYNTKDLQIYDPIYFRCRKGGKTYTPLKWVFG